MECCDKKPVIKLFGGEALCNRCFLNYFEKKVRKTVRIHKMIGKEESIGVANSGTLNSSVLLDILRRITHSNKKITFSVLNMELDTKGIGNINLCALQKKLIIDKTSILAIDSCLDDAAESVFLFYSGKEIAHSDLTPGIILEGQLKIIRPLYFCSEKEIGLYARLRNIKAAGQSRIKATKTSELLSIFEAKSPGTKNAIVNSFLEVAPLLKN